MDFEELYALLKNGGGGGGGGGSSGYKGSVATAAALPASGETGDWYYVTGEGVRQPRLTRCGREGRRINKCLY